MKETTLGLSLRFGSGNYTPTQEQPIRQTPVQVERQLKHPSLTEPMMEGSQSPSYSVQNLVKISGGAKQNKAGINDLPDSSPNATQPAVAIERVLDTPRCGFRDDSSDDFPDSQENTPRKITEKFESNSIKKLAKKALNNNDVKREYPKIEKQLEDGIEPVQIGSKSTKLRGNKVLIKGKHGRYLVETDGPDINILGIGDRSNKKNMDTFQKLMNDTYETDINY